MPGSPRMPEAPQAPGRAAWRPACSQREMSPSPRLSPALSASSTSTRGLRSTRQGALHSGGQPTNEELLAGRGGTRGEPRLTGPGRTTETSRQGLGLGDSGGRRSGEPAYLPQRRHKAASRTSTAPGGLRGEAQVHELNRSASGPARSRGPWKRAGRGWRGWRWAARGCLDAEGTSSTE